MKSGMNIYARNDQKSGQFESCGSKNKRSSGSWTYKAAH